MLEKVKVVVVEPLYQINMGYIARVSANFGIKKLNIVAPRCNYLGKEAIKYSKHASHLLKSARIYKDTAAATKDGGIIIGTTGIWHKSEGAFFNVYSLEKAAKLAEKAKKVTLLIGRDDTGLTKEELGNCDFTIFVPTSPSYPVLNISHALAIILYELSKTEEDSLGRFAADQKSIDGIVKLFSNSVKKRENIRNKKAVALAFRHVLMRSSPTRKEINAIAVALSDKYKTKRKRKVN